MQGGSGAELIYGFNPAGPQGTVSAIDANRVAAGFNQPVFVTAAPGDPGRLFVVEKSGVIKVLELGTGTVRATPFLNVSPSINPDGEQGLLGLAFHPISGRTASSTSTPATWPAIARSAATASRPTRTWRMPRASKAS